jgi:hypothetical protein
MFALRQMKVCTVRYHEHTSFIRIIFCLTESFNMVVVRNFEVLLGRTLNHFL